MRHHFTPIRMASNKKGGNYKCWWEAEKLEPSHIAVRNVQWCSHTGKLYSGSSKNKHIINMWSRNSTPIYILKRIESKDSNRYSYTDVHSSTVHNSWKVETPKCQSTNKWIKCGIYPYGRLLFILKKGMKFWHMLQCGWTLKTLCYMK